MTGVYRQSFDDTSNAQETELLGATDETRIGNVGDRLKVDASFSTPPAVKPVYAGSAARIIDMNAASGGVARDTAITSITVYTVLFNYTGSGTLFNLLVTLEGNLTGADPFNIKLEIDSQTVFDVSTLDIGTATLYNLADIYAENTMGIDVTNNTFKFASPRGGGLSYSNNVKVSIKRALAGSKRFRAGMIYLTKDT